jgi:heme a synthase
VSTSTPTSAWPSRLAVATFVAAVPLVLFGGTVTGTGSGMAVDGWLTVERGKGDYFMLFMPLEVWFRDFGTFVEHGHRLIGALVGFLAIATMLATFILDSRKAARALAAAALVVICAQGALGGFRVLENSRELAFLHGAFAQLVFATLAAAAVYLSPAWRAQSMQPCKQARGAQRLSLVTTGVVYATIFFGAMLRHNPSSHALLAHISFMVLAAVLVVVLARTLKRAAAAGDGRQPLLRSGKRLSMLLHIQLLLGVASYLVVWQGVGPTVKSIHASVYPTLHVLTGALLLAQCVAAAMWSRRVISRTAVAPDAALPQGSGGVA